MFWVFWDTMLKRVRIHHQDCGACRNGQGMQQGSIRVGRGSTYFWEEFPSYPEALRKTEQLRRAGMIAQGCRVNCSLCHPERANKDSA
ncbi:hypothetical protein V1280_007869 [Bradyrhizobium sp. AZCC 2230]